MIRGADLSHADICEISTELEAEENLDPQPPGHVHHHRRGRLRRQLSEAHRHPSPTVLSHQRDWPGRDVGAEQCRGTVRPACGTCAALLQSLGRPGCSGRRNCNVNLDELRGDRPDLDCEPQQAGGIPRNLQLDETIVVLFACRLRCSCEGCDRSCVVRVKVAVWGLCGGLGAVVDAPLGRASTDPGLARPEDPVRGDLWTVIDGVDRGDSDRRRLLQRARAEDE
jgi:hypothetical protein